MFVCLFVCWLVGLQAIYMIGCREREAHDCCLNSFGVFYLSNVWWDHIPDANCSGVERKRCIVDAGPGGYVMATVL